MLHCIVRTRGPAPRRRDPLGSNFRLQLRAPLHTFILGFGLVAAQGTVLATPTTVRIDSFSCSAGAYAAVLPRHYPSLHGIGRHSFSNLEVKPEGAGVQTTRQLDYYGLRLVVRISSATPNNYDLLSLDVDSRRWNIGALSVGRTPWRSISEPALEGKNRDGVLQILGGKDSVLVQLREGRVVKTSYRCSAAAPR